MKKIIITAAALILACLMLFSLAACGKTENTGDGEVKKSESEKEALVGDTENADTENAGETAPEEDSRVSFSFSGYTDTGAWPTEEDFAAAGLPYLKLTENVDGSVAISDANWIYPLDADDGILYEAKTSEEQIETLVSALEAAGIKGEYDGDAYPRSYTAKYEYEDTPMEIVLTQTEGAPDDGVLPKIQVLIKVKPE